MTYEDALATFEADPPIRDPLRGGRRRRRSRPATPLPRFAGELRLVADPGHASSRRWYLGADGSLGRPTRPADDAPADAYVADPDGAAGDVLRRRLERRSGRTDVAYDWQETAGRHGGLVRQPAARGRHAWWSAPARSTCGSAPTPATPTSR